MKALYLLDVNVLVALSWPGHVHHDKAHNWFAQHASQGWATCPMTEAGFVRIVSNASYSPQAVAVTDALAVLMANTAHPGHQFWPDDLRVADGLAGGRVVSHKQVTDAYLLALVIQHNAKLATFDKGILNLATEKTGRKHVEWIG